MKRFTLLLLSMHKSTFNATLHLVNVSMLQFCIAAAHIKLFWELWFSEVDVTPIEDIPLVIMNIVKSILISCVMLIAVYGLLIIILVCWDF